MMEHGQLGRSGHESDEITGYDPGMHNVIQKCPSHRASILSFVYIGGGYQSG